MPHVPPQVTHQMDSSPPILRLLQVWFQAKILKNTQVQHYNCNYTLLSILSTIAWLILLTSPYYILHQSQNLHTCPLTPLITDLSILLLYHDDHYPPFLVHNFNKTCTHPSTSKMTQANNLFFPFQILLLLNHVKK